MSNKKDSYSSEMKEKEIQFTKNTIFYQTILDTIEDSKEPMEFNEILNLLEKCIDGYYNRLKARLQEKNFSIVHNAALYLISRKSKTSTTQGDLYFPDIIDAVKTSAGNGFSDFDDNNARELLKELKEDYINIISKIFAIETYKRNGDHDIFTRVLMAYTALVALDVMQYGEFYNSNEYNGLVLKRSSAEWGGKSRSEDAEIEREKILIDFRERVQKALSADDNLSYSKLADDLIVDINAKTEKQIEDDFAKRLSLSKTDKENYDPPKNRKKRIQELTISKRIARSEAKKIWEKLEETKIEKSGESE